MQRPGERVGGLRRLPAEEEVLCGRGFIQQGCSHHSPRRQSGWAHPYVFPVVGHRWIRRGGCLMDRDQWWTAEARHGVDGWRLEHVVDGPEQSHGGGDQYEHPPIRCQVAGVVHVLGGHRGGGGHWGGWRRGGWHRGEFRRTGHGNNGRRVGGRAPWSSQCLSP